MMSAILPTQISGDAQTWVISTAGDHESLWLWQQIDAGRESITDPDSGRCHAEWCISDDVDENNLVDAALANHPALGLPGGPRAEVITLYRSELEPSAFAREFGNRWLTIDDVREIPFNAWERAISRAKLPDDQPSFGVDIMPDRSRSVIVASVNNVLEVIEDRAGADWVGVRLEELIDKWQPTAVVIDTPGPGSGSRKNCRSTGSCSPPAPLELCASCASVFDALAAQPPQASHRPTPAPTMPSGWPGNGRSVSAGPGNRLGV